MQVPFFRPQIGDAEIEEVVNCLRSGWLTTGPMTRRFEEQFAAAVGAKYAVALNSCTAALHLAVEALGLKVGQGVLVPTMTFAATAEVVRYLGAVPILVDCDEKEGNLCFDDAEQKLKQLRAGKLGERFSPDMEVVGIMPVHVGGVMLDVARIRSFASEHNLWIVEDAAHAFPAAWRSSSKDRWQRCGEQTADATCFSFYANKTITTAEGGMAVTDDATLADRIRSMSLHGLSRDAWNRYRGGAWDYRIVAPGYKYNLTDIAASIGIHQLARAEEMRQSRESLALQYNELLVDCEEIELPSVPANRIHAWHLYPIQLRLDRLTIDRDEFIEALKLSGVGCSVHWRPLHLHPYYEQEFHWQPETLPVATQAWKRRISLPLFPGMQRTEIEYVANAVRRICQQHSTRSTIPASFRQTSLPATVAKEAMS